MSLTFYISETVNSEYYYVLNVLKNLNHLNNIHVIASIAHTKEGIDDIIKNIHKFKKNILIQVSEETETPYTSDIYNLFHMVFRTYNNNNKFDNKKIFPIPCGYMTRLLPNVQTEIQIPELKQITDREYDIIFTGHGHPSSERGLCAQRLQQLKTTKKLVNLTNGFAQGYPLIEYFKLLNNTKISAVPKGVSINESFRFFESFRMGCIVITTLPILQDLYNKIWYYKNCPAITINNWSELSDNIVEKALENINKHFFDSKNYYQKYLSPEAVGQYISSKILE